MRHHLSIHFATQNTRDDRIIRSFLTIKFFLIIKSFLHKNIKFLDRVSVNYKGLLITGALCVSYERFNWYKGLFLYKFLILISLIRFFVLRYILSIRKYFLMLIGDVNHAHSSWTSLIFSILVYNVSEIRRFFCL